MLTTPARDRQRPVGVETVGGTGKYHHASSEQENHGMNRPARTACALAAALLLASAGRAEDFPADKAKTAVTGKVLYKKANAADRGPIRAPVAMDGKPECAALHGDKKNLAETVIVDNNGGTMTVRNVFVYVKEGLEKYTFPTPKEPVVLDQVGCIYTPHVFGIMVGQPLEVRNSDPLSHNVHYIPGNSKEINVSQAGKGVKNEVKFLAAEVLAVFKCDVHAWMKCYVGVLEHPFYAVTDEKGEFTLPKLPPGKYVIAAKHETGKEKTFELTIAEGDSDKTATFEFGRLDLRARN
jgi:hypothetical protein